MNSQPEWKHCVVVILKVKSINQKYWVNKGPVHFQFKPLGALFFYQVCLCYWLNNVIFHLAITRLKIHHVYLHHPCTDTLHVDIPILAVYTPTSFLPGTQLNGLVYLDFPSGQRLQVSIQSTNQKVLGFDFYWECLEFYFLWVWLHPSLNKILFHLKKKFLIVLLRGKQNVIY